MSRVTIISDASYCHQSKAAGCGFWIASDRGKLGGSHAFRLPVKDAQVAEVMGVYAALHKAAEQGLVQENDEVLIQMDCMGALNRFNGHTAPREGQEMEYVDKMKLLIVRLSIQVEYRHVKAHSDALGARFTTIQLCDQRAKEAMRHRRATFAEDKRSIAHIQENLL